LHFAGIHVQVIWGVAIFDLFFFSPPEGQNTKSVVHLLSTEHCCTILQVGLPACANALGMSTQDCQMQGRGAQSNVRFGQSEAPVRYLHLEYVQCSYELYTVYIWRLPFYAVMCWQRKAVAHRAAMFVHLDRPCFFDLNHACRFPLGR
jgi:hypothetical protein